MAPVVHLPSALLERAVEASSGRGDPRAVTQAIVAHLDGAHPDQLVLALDTLREHQAYAVSIPLLEEAWNADLDLDLAGRVAEDWVGSVLHGLGDRAGAAEVAAHLVQGALWRGPAFAGELGHVFLGWELVDAADPLLREAGRSRPGDTAVQFDLGVLLKLRGEWPQSHICLRRVVAAHPEERSAWWHLGVVCTALADWPGAREAWGQVGFDLPPGDGDFASPGEPTPVRLPTAPGAPADHEVVWGERLCPARVRLTGLPCWPQGGEYGDVVLVDGAATGELTGPDGRKVPILPALAVLESYGGRTVVAEVEDPSQVAEALRVHSWPAADWTGLAGPEPRVALVVGPDRQLTSALDLLRQVAPEMRLAPGAEP